MDMNKRIAPSSLGLGTKSRDDQSVGGHNSRALRHNSTYTAAAATHHLHPQMDRSACGGGGGGGVVMMVVVVVAVEVIVLVVAVELVAVPYGQILLSDGVGGAILEQEK